MAFQLQGTNRQLAGGVRFVKCASCGRIADPMPPEGKGTKQILVVFEQPTTTQWSARSWFAGGDATVLQILHKLGILLQEDLFVTAVLPCSGNNSGAIRYEDCLIKLQTTISDCNPKLIISVGPVATGAVLRLYNSRHYAPNYTTSQFQGQCIPLVSEDSAIHDCWLAPVQSDKEIHANRNAQMQQVAKDWVLDSLKWALDAAVNRPRKTEFPKVEILYGTDAIVAALRQTTAYKYAAFDYETNCLHPESENAKILTAAVTMADSDEIKRTVAFPMASEVVKKEWCRFLQSPVLKIGANIKFEHRWSSVWLKTPVVNWKWDVCVGGRVFDCSPGNSGLKYLTFTLFGVIGYDDSVESFIKDDSSGYNRLDRMNVADLLQYNGLDAVYTYLVAKRQCGMLNLDF